MSRPKYWKGVEERDQTPAFRQTLEREFPEPLTLTPLIASTTDWSRRSFLMATGFSLAATTLSSCSREPLERAIPLLVQDETSEPGKSYWYASTCGGCQAGCGILTKNRDGRPIKIEGNPEHPLSRGGLCAVGQAMTLGVYDSKRLGQPMEAGTNSDWSAVDAKITEALRQTRSGVYVLTGTLSSPSGKAAIQEFTARFTDSAHVTWDAGSCPAILDAHALTHGHRLLPHYRFDRAEVIVSVDADFLGTWLSPVEFTKDYMTGRALTGPEPRLSYHAQFEARFSLTGAAADRRFPVGPAEYAPVLQYLARRIGSKAGTTLFQVSSVAGDAGIDESLFAELADRLWEARGKSLLVCAVNDIGLQCMVNAINHLLGNYGATLDLDQPSQQWQGSDSEVRNLIAKMQAGEVNALIIAGANPVYGLPDGKAFADALSRVPLTICLTQHPDETSAQCRFTLPAAHALESWDDAEPVSGLISVTQPTLAAMVQSRTLRACLSAWTGGGGDDHHLLQTFWQNALYPRRLAETPFQAFWDRAVHDGFVRVAPVPPTGATYQTTEWPVVSDQKLEPGAYALAVYASHSMRDGRHAHNAWLHELPDPMTKVTWENYVSMAPALTASLGLSEGDIVTLTGGGASLDLPVHVQPGQSEKVVAIASGYGRVGTDRFAQIGAEWIGANPTVAQGAVIGANAYRLTVFRGNAVQPVTGVTIKPTGQRVDLALTQTHHTITTPENLGGERRDLVREVTLAEFRQELPREAERTPPELWADDYPATGHRWGMAIDLNRCTGCSACVLACQVENNIPVVGKDEVFRRREMSWIRLDRYYSDEGGQTDALMQPVMCQHCGHAPCETVCPVLATVHSDEGLNQQIYNRCVGTRYCANNCPYKVRRFNWFDYWKRDEQEHLTLNPDLTTRSRGVMEKCSMCVQRIQEVKATAKRKDQPLDEGAIQTACQQSCPADAIVFGDLNNPGSPLNTLTKSSRYYRMLEEMNFRPSVGYLARVRNRA